MNIFIKVQKKAVYYTYPMGMDRWKTTIFYFVREDVGTRKVMEGMYSRQTQMFMYDYAR